MLGVGFCDAQMLFGCVTCSGALSTSIGEFSSCTGEMESLGDVRSKGDSGESGPSLNVGRK